MVTQFINCLWNRIITLGVRKEDPYSKSKFVIFTNLVSFLTAVSVACYIPFSLLNGYNTLALVQLIDVLCVVSALYLNSRGHYTAASMVFIGVVNTFVFFNALYIGFDSKVHEFFYLSNVIPFLLFPIRQSKKIALGVAAALGGFAAYYYMYPLFTQYNLSPATQLSIYQINIAMKFFLFGVAIYILARYNDRAEQQLENTNKKLEEFSAELQRSNQDLQQFAYIISHDLKAPVRSISSFLSLYRKKFGHTIPEEGKDFLDMSYDSSIRLAKLIDDLLAYSRVGRNLPEGADVDVTLLLKTIEIELGDRLKERNAEIIIEGPMPVLPNMHSTMLYHIFQNLLTNGIKFNENKTPKVSVSHLAYGKQHLFTVRDNGIGIDKKFSDGLFQMFRRLHSDEYEGTGIGLAVCKKIVLFYGGQIWFESEPGYGTTFHFVIPELNKAPATGLKPEPLNVAAPVLQAV